MIAKECMTLLLLVTSGFVSCISYNDAGQTAAMTGGLSGDLHILSSVATYCTGTTHGGCKTSIPDLLRPRFVHGAGILTDGTIVVVGGEDGSGDLLNTAEIYSPGQKTWTSVANMTDARKNPAVAAMDDSVFACGGVNLKTGYLKTCETMSRVRPGSVWKRLPDMQRYHSGAAASFVSGDLWVIGGWNGTSESAFVERFNLNSSTWTPIAPLILPRFQHSATTLNNTPYVCGGNSANGSTFADCERYDATISRWKSIAPMHNSRYLFNLVAMGDKIYALAGCSHGDTKISVVEAYDPSKNIWKVVGNLNAPRCGYGAVVLK